MTDTKQHTHLTRTYQTLDLLGMEWFEARTFLREQALVRYGSHEQESFWFGVVLVADKTPNLCSYCGDPLGAVECSDFRRALADYLWERVEPVCPTCEDPIERMDMVEVAVPPQPSLTTDRAGPIGWVDTERKFMATPCGHLHDEERWKMKVVMTDTEPCPRCDGVGQIGPIKCDNCEATGTVPR